MTFGDAATDTAFDILDTVNTACDSIITYSGEGATRGVQDNSPDNEDAVTDPLQSTAFCVLVLAGSEWTPAHTSYQLGVWLESPQ